MTEAQLQEAMLSYHVSAARELVYRVKYNEYPGDTITRALFEREHLQARVQNLIKVIAKLNTKVRNQRAALRSAAPMVQAMSRLMNAYQTVSTEGGDSLCQETSPTTANESTER